MISFHDEPSAGDSTEKSPRLPLQRFNASTLQPILISCFPVPPVWPSSGHVFRSSIRSFCRHLRRGHGLDGRGDGGQGISRNRIGPERLSAHVHVFGGPE